MPRLANTSEYDESRNWSELDRAIAQARGLLAEAAQARLEINLRAAQMAGSNETSTGPFLKQVRESLKSLECCVLELRDVAEECRSERQTGTAHAPIGSQAAEPRFATSPGRSISCARPFPVYEVAHRRSSSPERLESLTKTKTPCGADWNRSARRGTLSLTLPKDCGRGPPLGKTDVNRPAATASNMAHRWRVAARRLASRRRRAAPQRRRWTR